jgi:hypothetical protein
MPKAGTSLPPAPIPSGTIVVVGTTPAVKGGSPTSIAPGNAGGCVVKDGFGASADAEGFRTLEPSVWSWGRSESRRMQRCWRLVVSGLPLPPESTGA